MIDTVNGFAPFMWQNGVGPALFVRNDLGPFGREMLLFCHDFAADIRYPLNIVEVCSLKMRNALCFLFVFFACIKQKQKCWERHVKRYRDEGNLPREYEQLLM
jgi:hypothetical protein